MSFQTKFFYKFILSKSIDFLIRNNLVKTIIDKKKVKVLITLKY